MISFDHLSNLVTQLHNSAYTASVKAVNRFATVRNYVIGFYLNYPHIKSYLEGKSATASHQFITPAEQIISQLSFSHIREIMTVNDSLARFFYENGVYPVLTLAS